MTFLPEISTNKLALLITMLRSAFDGCSSYHDRFLASGFSDFDGFEASHLSELPLIEAADLIAEPHGFRNRNATPYRISGSSGTTNRPKLLFRTTEDTKNSVDAMVELLSMAGMRAGDTLMIGQPFDLAHLGYITLEACKRLKVLSIPTGLGLTDNQMLTWINAFAPLKIFTSPSRLRSLIILANERDTPLAVEDALLAGEPCPSSTRRLIEEELGIHAHDLYGSEETDGLAGSCRSQNGLHLLDDRFIIELLEPGTNRPASGDRGEIVVTSLFCFGTPLIRYRLGDLVELKRGRCKCGAVSPRIIVLGRTNEAFHLFDGVTLHKYQVEAALENALGPVDQFQAIRETDANGCDVITLTIAMQERDDIDPVQLKEALWECSLDIGFLRDIERLRWEINLGGSFTIEKGRKTPNFIDQTREET